MCCTAVPAGSTVELTCTRVGQWPSPFLAIIQAVAGTETCDDTDDLRNTITVNTKPNVAVTAERSSRSVCANAANGVNPGTVTLGSSGSVTLAYTVTGLGSHTPVLTATSFHQSVTCDPPVHQGMQTQDPGVAGGMLADSLLVTMLSVCKPGSCAPTTGPAAAAVFQVVQGC